MIRSMCCRLQLDLRQIPSSAATASSARGADGVRSAWWGRSTGRVWLSSSRMTRRASAPPRLLDLRRRASRSSARSCSATSTGLFPYTKRYLGLRNHFSTISINGINEIIPPTSPRQGGHRNGLGPCLCVAPARRARARPSIPGGDGPHVQPRGDAGRGTTYRFAKGPRGAPASCRQARPRIRSTRNSWQCPSTYGRPVEALRRQDTATKYTAARAPLYMNEAAISPEASRPAVRGARSRFRLRTSRCAQHSGSVPSTVISRGRHDFSEVRRHCWQNARRPAREEAS